jgi:hypothetical protein
MRWLHILGSSHLVAKAKDAAAEEALAVEKVLSSIRPIKTANSGDEIHLYVDPRMAGKYKINLHLMEQNDKERTAEVSAEPSIKTATVESSGADFQETTVSFVSKKTSDPNYLATIVLQKPEDKVWAVSAYLMETYLGRYAFRANFYFRKESSKNAKKCYERVSRAIQEMRQDVVDDNLLQNSIPRLMRKRLSSIEGEVEPRINKMAIYLDPENQVEPIGPETSPASYIPNKRSVTDDLFLEG